MKIGLLTLPLHINYGGILQAYALDTVLERMGNDVVVINEKYHHKRPPITNLNVYFRRFVRKYILHRNIRVFQEDYDNRIYPILSQNTQLFIEKYINYIEKKSLKTKNTLNFDLIVAGSDQVWRPLYYPEIEDAFLKFAEYWNVKRFSYAASFGTNLWEYTEEQTLKCKKLIKLFDAVSVREDTGVILCKKYLESDAIHVLDPTMLLNGDDYVRLLHLEKMQTNVGNMFCYILDQTIEKKALINRVVEERQLQPFFVGGDEDGAERNFLHSIQPPVEKWLKAFMDAEFVVTDSFHGCVFSILFRKPFVAYGNNSRGMSRFQSLLGMLGLQDRLITSLDNYHQMHNIDYDAVYHKLEKMRAISYQFLENALS